MAASFSVDLIKQLLVACDQSYVTAPLAKGTALAHLPDQGYSGGDYANSLVYNTNPRFTIAPGYEVKANLFDNNTGGKVVIYQNANHDVIVAFGGTDGTDLKDWFGNTQHVGWNQWDAMKKPGIDVLGVVAALNPANVHFTGQSLGGALAQYAAYEYVKSNAGTNGFDKSTVSVTTFNGLGAQWGLKNNGGYDAKVLDGIGSATHYVVQGDIVARLGGGHIGSGDTVVYLPWTYLDGKSKGKPMSIVDAHRIETAFYTHVDEAGSELLGGISLFEASRLIGGVDSVKWAGAIGSLLNDEKVTPPEALFRLIAGIGGASILANPVELDEVLQAAIETQYKAGELSQVSYDILSSLNLGWVSKAVFLTKPGLAITAGSVLAAAAVQTIDTLGGWIGGAFQWLADKVNVNIPSTATAPAASSPEDADINLRQGLVNCPDAFAAESDKHRARIIADALGTDQPIDALLTIVTNEAAPTRAGLITLMNLVLTGTRYQSLDAAGRGKLLAEVASAYEYLTLDPLTDNLPETQALSAEIVQGIQDFNNDLQSAMAAANPDYLGGAGGALTLSPITDFNQRKGFTDGLLAGLKELANSVANLIASPAHAEEFVRTVKETAKDITESAQTIVITAGVANPMDIATSFDPNGVESGTLNESHARFYTLFLAYPAGEGGQKIQLTLQGASAGTLALLANNRKQAFDGGSVELTVPAGSDRLAIVLLSEEDHDQADALTLQAQLLNASGQATHASHLEINLALNAHDESATTRDILGDLRPETPESTDELGNVKVSGTAEPGREDRLNDSDGGDRIEGRSGRDILDARRGGNDLILAGAGSDIATGGDGDDRLHAGPDDTPLDQAIALGNSPGGGGDKGDWLNGAAANDPIRILAA